jgi:predicted RNase H-like HicB family nuclease
VLQLQAVEAEIFAGRKTRLVLPRIVLDSAGPIGTYSGKMEVSMVEIQPIRVEIEREDDGRILASVPDLPGVMAYGSTEDEAIRKVKSIALQVLADMIESGEDVPGPLKVLFAA